MSYQKLLSGLVYVAVVASACVVQAQLFGGHGGGHFQRLHANRFGGANCGREIHQSAAEVYWDNYCHDDCTLSGRHGCGGCGLSLGRGCGGCDRGGQGCGCGHARHGFGDRQGCCQNSGCFANGFGWPNACDGCANSGGRWAGQRSFRTFDQFNDCGCNDGNRGRNHGCSLCSHRQRGGHCGCSSRLGWNDWRDNGPLSHCGLRGRFFGYAVGHEFGCGDICSSVNGRITSSCGCESGATYQGHGDPRGAVEPSAQPSPSDVHQNGVQW